MDHSSQVTTIDRLARVLNCFTQEQPTWSLAELAAQLELPKSTLHRFLVGLEAHGILHRNLIDKRWRLGYRLFVWGSLVEEDNALREVARPSLCELVDTSGETALLSVYRKGEVICTDKCDTSHPVRLKMEVGTRHSPHAGASSKILMAYLPEAEIQMIVEDKGLPKLCTNTITDRAELEAELARIRKRGWAESLEETDLGAWGVASPIRDRKGQVVAAIGLAGPTMRYSREKVRQYVILCRQSANKISSLL